MAAMKQPCRVAAATATVLAFLSVTACSAPADPYYGELEQAGWASDSLTQAELHALYEDMAREVCGEVREALADGANDDEVMQRALPLIDSADPTSSTAVAALSAMLDHRCDASQPDGLKTS